MKLLLLALLAGVSALGTQTSVALEPSGKHSATAARVLIEAAIMEVSPKDSESPSRSLFDGRAHVPNDYSLGAGALSRSNLLSVTRLAPIVQTKDARGKLGGLAYSARVGNDLDALVTTLAGDSRVRILQRPRIETSDGVTATIFVGEARPFPAGTYYDQPGALSSIQQLQTGVTIEVTPFVKPDAFVMLDIHQKIDRPAGSVTIANVGEVPITSSTEAQAKVVVRDRETILLGGWIETVENRTPSGVPLLKDLPVLGALFRGSSTRTAWNELIVLIRPTVLPNSEAATVPRKTKNNEQAETKR